MIRIFGPGLFGMMMVALWIYAVLDAIATEEMLVRNLPKMAWLLIVLAFPGIGAIAWLALGRPVYAGWRPGDTGSRPSRPSRQVRGPEDSDGWQSSASRTSSADLAARERRIQEREAELERRERGLGDGN